MARKTPKISHLRRADSGSVERLTLRLPKDLAQKLKIRCIEERRSLSDGVSVAVTEWLKGRST